MPVALAGIGRLPSATEDRCIRIVLLRKPATRRTARFNKAKKAELRLLTPQIRRWMQDNRKAIVPNLEPVFPPEVDNDRDEDLWRPLLAIADTMGGDVAVLARRAMLELIAVAHEPGEGEELMAALFDILSLELTNRADEKGDIKIALSRLVGLVNSHDGPWTEYRNGLGCDQRWLSTDLEAVQAPGTERPRPTLSRWRISQGLCRPRHPGGRRPVPHQGRGGRRRKRRAT